MKLQLDEDIPWVQGDLSQIRQIILNLMTNASEAMEGKSGSISLKTHLADRVEMAYSHPDLKAASYLCLTVTDQGCGMEKEVLERIFDPFFTTKFTGRGLGLASALGIARTHNGKLTVTSTPDVGTVFQLFLPVSNVTQPPQSEVPSRSFVKTPRMSVLVVDDEVSVRRVIKGLLTQVGHRVLTANDGVEALDLLMKHDSEIDLVILDLIMPRKDGYDTLIELRSYWPKLPVILSSGYSERAVFSKAKSQVQGFLRKPFSKPRLLEELNTALKAVERSDCIESGQEKPMTLEPKADRD